MFAKQGNMKHEQQWLGSSIKGYYSIHRLFHIAISSAAQYSDRYLDFPCLDLGTRVRTHAHTHTHTHTLTYLAVLTVCPHVCQLSPLTGRVDHSIVFSLWHCVISTLCHFFFFWPYSFMAWHFFPHDPLSASHRLFHHQSIRIDCVFVCFKCLPSGPVDWALADLSHTCCEVIAVIMSRRGARDYKALKGYGNNLHFWGYRSCYFWDFPSKDQRLHPLCDQEARAIYYYC